ncbi:MAG: hypothetical protein WC155_02460 [Candidatus Cloacimonadales bacterium]
MLSRIATSISILIIILSIYPGIPPEFSVLAKSLILIAAGYRIYRYIASQHWEWVLPFFVLILYINPFFSFPIAEMANGYTLDLILKAASIFLLGYSFKHIS